MGNIYNINLNTSDGPATPNNVHSFVSKQSNLELGCVAKNIYINYCSLSTIEKAINILLLNKYKLGGNRYLLCI